MPPLASWGGGHGPLGPPLNPPLVAYGAQKLQFVVSSGIISCDACLDADVILKISLFLRSAYFNAFQALQVCHVVDGDIL